MTAGQLYPLPRRLALSIGLTLVRWAHRSTPLRHRDRAALSSAAERTRAMLRYRTAREVAAQQDLELRRLLNQPRQL